MLENPSGGAVGNDSGLSSAFGNRDRADPNLSLAESRL